ncbi:MAG TPA: hypothetical protein VHT91_05545 [Kofleriaceae bacterium]|jgi:hypothetical protein|nr:hypothetical protein [Kofleriaceae bacterium]
MSSNLADSMARDFLDEIEAERTAANPKFPSLVGEAAWRRKVARKLVTIVRRST